MQIHKQIKKQTSKETKQQKNKTKSSSWVRKKFNNNNIHTNENKRGFCKNRPGTFSDILLNVSSSCCEDERTASSSLVFFSSKQNNRWKRIILENQLLQHDRYSIWHLACSSMQCSGIFGGERSILLREMRGRHLGFSKQRERNYQGDGR